MPGQRAIFGDGDGNEAAGKDTERGGRRTLIKEGRKNTTETSGLVCLIPDHDCIRSLTVQLTVFCGTGSDPERATTLPFGWTGSPDDCPTLPHFAHI
jgi:hypothetical protein